jgi:glycosyltransferase involved in cell wall biosynthesis
MKISIFQNIPSIYRSSIFYALSKHPEISDFQVYYFSRGVVGYNHWIDDKTISASLKLVQHEFIPKSKKNLGFTETVSPPVSNDFFRDRSFGDVCILTGYASPADWQALFWLKLSKHPIVLWYGSTLNTSNDNFLKKSLKKLFFSQVDTFITYGTCATDCLLQYGVEKNRIVTGCNVTDTIFFNCSQDFAEKIDIDFQWFYSGQLIHRKGLDIFLVAISSMTNLPDWHLTVAGSGEMNLNYKELVVQLGIAEKVTFLGNQTYQQLKTHYQKSDGLVFLSRQEVWGLVANEAIHCGCPVLASNKAGATPDIIQENVNGIVCDINDNLHVQSSIRNMMTTSWSRAQVANSLCWANPEFQANLIVDACYKSST